MDFPTEGPARPFSSTDRLGLLVAIRDDPTLDKVGLCVLIAIAMRLDGDGEAHVSLSTIATDARCSRSRVCEALRRVKQEDRQIRLVATPSGPRGTNSYRFVVREGSP